MSYVLSLIHTYIGPDINEHLNLKMQGFIHIIVYHKYTKKW